MQSPVFRRMKAKKLYNDTECVTDLDEQSKMIIFGSILTTLNLEKILEAAVTALKIGSSLKPNHHWEI